MAGLSYALAILFLPVVVLILAFIDFLVMKATRQPATSFALAILGFIFLVAGISLYFSNDPLLSMPGVIVLLFGSMQLIYGAYMMRQYQKKPQWEGM